MYLLINKTYDPTGESPDYVVIGPMVGRDHAMAMDAMRVVDSNEFGLVGWFSDLQDLLVPHEGLEFKTPLQYFSERRDYLERHLEWYENEKLPLVLKRYESAARLQAQIRADLDRHRKQQSIAARRAAELA